MQRDGHSHLPNMRAIQSNLAMIGRNVSNLSPHASCMMDGIFLWQREARSNASVGLEASVCVFRGGVHQARVAACSHAYQCLLCGYAARWFLLCLCSCFSNPTRRFGRAMQELLIQKLDVAMWYENSKQRVFLRRPTSSHEIIFDIICQPPSCTYQVLELRSCVQPCSLPVPQSAVQEFSFVVLVYKAYHKLVWVSQSFLCCMVST